MKPYREVAQGSLSTMRMKVEVEAIKMEYLDSRDGILR